jgi:hypothetical protein
MKVLGIFRSSSKTTSRKWTSSPSWIEGSRNILIIVQNNPEVDKQGLSWMNVSCNISDHHPKPAGNQCVTDSWKITLKINISHILNPNITK